MASLKTLDVKKPGLPPFLKWAGGKRWLLESYPDIFPQDFKRYLEPFLGGGAVFFELRPKVAVLSDQNSELINCYRAVKSSWRVLVEELRTHGNKHSDKYYYEVRASDPSAAIERAARFLYLNRTCWNGLYRVNKLGQFNVPKGTKTAVILESDNFQESARALRQATLVKCDFQETIDSSVAGDFIFVDPPYTVSHNNNGFIKYNEKIFSWEDQIRLRDSLQRANARGVRFLLTNANHEPLSRMYEEFKIEKIDRYSVISAKAHGRALTSELLIRNY